MKTMLMSLILLTAAATVSAGEPVVLDECLGLAAAARQVAPGTHEIAAAVQWTCDPSVVGHGTLKMTVNGSPAGEAMSFDGTTPVIMRATVVDAALPLKVCVQLGAFDVNGEPTVSARACASAPVTGTVTATAPTTTRRGHVRR